MELSIYYSGMLRNVCQLPVSNGDLLNQVSFNLFNNHLKSFKNELHQFNSGGIT